MSNVQSSSWAQGAPPKSRRGLVATAIILGVLVIVISVIAALALRGMLPFGAAAAAAGPAESDKLTLEPANSIGQNPFAGTSLAATVNAAPVARATATVALTSATTIGSTPGLYGGSNDPAVCKIDQLVTFLQANPQKAQAWVGALNSDPNLRWGLGKLTVADIPKYVATLTAIQLTADTRVTNHGFSDTSGVAFPLQSLLQKGTAVLVDKYGVPRVKCNCGNPLLPPQPLSPPTPVNPPPASEEPPPSSEEPCLPPPVIVPDGMGPDSDCEPDPPTEECQSETFDGCDPGDPSVTIEIEVTEESESWEGIGDEPVDDIEPSETPLETFVVTLDDGSTKEIPSGCADNGQCTQVDDATNPNVLAAPSATDPGTSGTTGNPPAVITTPVAPVSFPCNSDDPTIDQTITYSGSITNGRSVPIDIFIVDGVCALRYLETIPAGGTFSGYTFYGDVIYLATAGSPDVVGSVNGRGADFAVTF